MTQFNNMDAPTLMINFMTLLFGAKKFQIKFNEGQITQLYRVDSSQLWTTILNNNNSNVIIESPDVKNCQDLRAFKCRIQKEGREFDITAKFEKSYAKIFIEKFFESPTALPKESYHGLHVMNYKKSYVPEDINTDATAYVLLNVSVDANKAIPPFFKRNSKVKSVHIRGNDSIDETTNNNNNNQIVLSNKKRKQDQSNNNAVGGK